VEGNIDGLCQDNLEPIYVYTTTKEWYDLCVEVAMSVNHITVVI